MKPESITQVLMIDDDENDALLVRHMLEKIPDSGCQFHWARSYDQGLKMLGESAWDLCLLDYQLGAHTGVEVVMESRTRGLVCPFLLLTGVGSRAIDLQAMRAGVVGYMEKSRLCPLELERAIRYAIGTRPAHQQSASSATSHVPPEVAELLTASFASKKHFVVITLMLDRESALRSHLGPSEVDRINTDLEALVRARISSGEALFRNSEGALMLVSGSQESSDGRHFLSQLLAEPMAVAGGGRSRSISLPAIVRRNVLASAGYLNPAALISDLDAFCAIRQLSHGYDLRPTALISDLHGFFAH
jgi:DNA-binding NarL/FixJ family response regulator